MKDSILLALLCSTSGAIAQNTNPVPVSSVSTVSSTAEMTFEKKEHDFGTITQNVPVIAKYKFKNTGTQPIIISQVKKTCGCTVPKWPEQPILPGEEAVIEAEYNAKSPGAFNKTITVVSNAEENYIYLRLKGKVITPETTFEE